MLSVVITAWNEEKNLPRVVASVKDLADEIIVVDTESTDKTEAVAKKLGCKVFHHPNTMVVEPVRNFSISKANGDWILLLDADEEVSETLRQKIKEIVSSSEGDFYRLPRKNIIFDKWIKTSHWWPDYVYRLFKKGSVTWKNTIHSIPETQGRGVDLPANEENAIVHHHYDSISQYIERINRYTDYQSQELLTGGYKFAWEDLIIKPTSEFLTQYFSRKAYLEGVHGLALAMLQMFSEVTLYLKAWQAEDFPQKIISQHELHHVIEDKAREYRWWQQEVEINSSGVMDRWVLKLQRKLEIWLG